MLSRERPVELLARGIPDLPGAENAPRASDPGDPACEVDSMAVQIARALERRAIGDAGANAGKLGLLDRLDQ